MEIIHEAPASVVVVVQGPPRRSSRIAARDARRIKAAADAVNDVALQRVAAAVSPRVRVIIRKEKSAPPKAQVLVPLRRSSRIADQMASKMAEARGRAM